MLSRRILGLYSHRIAFLQNAFAQNTRSFADSSAKDDLYRILGVNSEATQTEIKDAYYNLTLKFHPDKNEGRPEAAAKFHEITDAYEVLGNYFMRKRYDAGLPLPARHEAPSMDPIIPHVVKYQKFFESRNLPFLPSAYAAGGGARKFDEYHSQQFSDRRVKSTMEDELRAWDEECRNKKTPTFIALMMLFVITIVVGKEFDFYTDARTEIEHFQDTYLPKNV